MELEVMDRHSNNFNLLFRYTLSYNVPQHRSSERNQYGSVVESTACATVSKVTNLLRVSTVVWRSRFDSSNATLPCGIVGKAGWCKKGYD
jgi:hypothetical protein